MSKTTSSEAQAGGSASSATETTPLIATNVVEEPDNGGGGGGGAASAGLSAKQTAFLIAGEMAGSGVLALPRALVKTGWVGVPIIIGMCAIAAFSGKRLGDCWSIIEGRDPEMRSRKRNPYAIIADQALGRTWSVIVSMAVTVTLFGAAVVYLLLAAQIIEQVLHSLIPAVTFCSWYLIVAGAMTPLMLFGTPRDFSFIGVVALGATVLACALYFIQMMSEVRPFVFRLGIHGFEDFFLAFGTIMFAFGGASTFPTIQNDMADKSKFSKSLQWSFIESTGWRFAVRLSIMAGLLFIGESIPRFDKILALVGGTSVALLTFILPSYCYLNLIKQSRAEGQKPIETPGWMKMVCWEVIAVGVVGGVATTISAISTIFGSTLTKPCYL
ncbi:uncharacterized protein LOC135086995 isoform X2 [Ostrinia nubilalis]|uniref:uncharacterized protein LOC135086995 isoform X2 n=1 Tax=Ostrinia nubilalis TaxID=29057 RepID=UPI003082521F